MPRAQSRGGQTVVALWVRYVTCYDINMTPLKVLFHSAEHRAATHSKVPDLMWMQLYEERKKDHRLIRATPSIQILETSERTRHTEVEHIWGLRVQDPDPCGWDETHTVPRPCTSVTHPVSRVTPRPISCTLGHMTSASRVTPPSTSFTWGQISTLSRVTSSQTLHVGSHVHSLQGDPMSQILHLSHMSTVSMVTPPRLHLGSHIHSSHGDPTLALYLWSHVHSFRVSSLPRSVPEVRKYLPMRVLIEGRGEGDDRG